MKIYGDTAESRRARAQNRIMAGVLALLFVQLGLFTAAWERALGREYGQALAFFLISAACFAVNLILLKRLNALDAHGND